MKRHTPKFAARGMSARTQRPSERDTKRLRSAVSLAVVTATSAVVSSLIGRSIGPRRCGDRGVAYGDRSVSSSPGHVAEERACLGDICAGFAVISLFSACFAEPLRCCRDS